MTILIDAREYTPGRRTGIGRVLEGLTDALAESSDAPHIVLASQYPDSMPARLTNKRNVTPLRLPRSFLRSEKTLSDLSGRDARLYLSPYPKLPLFGCFCPAVHVIHDVLDLTHPAYQKRLKIYFDTFRLKRALKRADLTWYVSSWSLEETRNYAGQVGKNPKVRHNGIAEGFTPKKEKNEENNLEKHRVEPGYVLVVGNGLPHKNLGALLEVANQLGRQLLFVGVSARNRGYWESRYPKARAVWIEHVPDEDLPAIMRNAFCLAQPSTAEGYGYPPLESMACGVPAVVSDIPVLKETTGGNGLIAAPHEPMRWAEAFRALENHDLRKLKIEEGLTWVEPLRGRKAWEKHLQDVEALLASRGTPMGRGKGLSSDGNICR